MSDMPPPAGHNRLHGIDPEKLIQIDIEDIKLLLDQQYGALALRTTELEARATGWETEHTIEGGALAIADDADLARTTDLYKQIADHAADGGEVDDTRKKVKLGPWQACQAIDAHFKRQTAHLTNWLYAVTDAQKGYAREQRAREAREAAARAEAARQEANRRLLEARAAQTPETLEKAIAAEERADLATEAAAAPVKAAPVRSTIGSSTSIGSKRDYAVNDMKALCRGVADGTVPVTFVMPVESAIRLALRGKPPMTECPGLTIFDDVTIRRRGA